MKRFFHKILSIILTCAVLFTTTGFAVDMHFCCDKLVDVAVLGNAKPCNEKVQKTEKPSKKCDIGDKDCCVDSTFLNEGNDNLKKVVFEFSAENFVFLQTFFYSYINLFKGLEKKVTPFLNYNPPLISKDILVLHETFLI